jgi:hypothetical protein
MKESDIMLKLKLKNNAQKIMRKISYQAAVKNANTACGWWQHQPEQPNAVKKLRKF